MVLRDYAAGTTHSRRRRPRRTGPRSRRAARSSHRTAPRSRRAGPPRGPRPPDSPTMWSAGTPGQSRHGMMGLVPHPPRARHRPPDTDDQEDAHGDLRHAAPRRHREEHRPRRDARGPHREGGDEPERRRAAHDRHRPRHRAGREAHLFLRRRRREEGAARPRPEAAGEGGAPDRPQAPPGRHRRRLPHRARGRGDPAGPAAHQRDGVLHPGHPHGRRHRRRARLRPWTTRRCACGCSRRCSARSPGMC